MSPNQINVAAAEAQNQAETVCKISEQVRLLLIILTEELIRVLLNMTPTSRT